MKKEKVVYAIYVKTTPDKIWEALTKSEFTRQYFWGVNVESDWKQGSTIRNLGDDGTIYSEGIILQAEKGKILSQTGRIIAPDGTKGKESIVTFEIEQHGDVCKLIVKHEHSSEEHKNALNGWEMSMGSLKSLLETGKALPFSA